jgi:hypothetical protein
MESRNVAEDVGNVPQRRYGRMDVFILASRESALASVIPAKGRAAHFPNTWLYGRPNRWVVSCESNV